MDRRQKKTRTAIFEAFTELLSKKSYSQISVQDILDRADVGRSTFYAHFDTKDDLMDALCRELFDHIINHALDQTHTHGLLPREEKNASLFFHILAHLQENDGNILRLISSESNGSFLRYFKEGMKEVVSASLPKEAFSQTNIPKNFVLNHSSGSFISMVEWWISTGMKQSPKELDEWFFRLFPDNFRL